MEPEDAKPSEQNEAKWDRSDYIMVGILLSIVLAMAFLVTSLVSTIPGSNLPLWASATIGIMIAGGIAWSASVSNSHTMLDTIITLSIILFLGVILVPIFKQAQKRARMKKEKSTLTYRIIFPSDCYSPLIGGNRTR